VACCIDSGAGTTSNSSSDSQKERRDFDDSANALWSLYGKEAKTYDEARIQSLTADMDGIPTFAGLFSAVLTSFLVQSIQNLQANPVEQSTYYQQQSVTMLAQITQQIASTTLQVPVASALPPPYPTFRPSDSDIRVNIYWSIGLVCSLSAGVLAILIRQWARSYMQAFQRYDHPLKKARFRQFFFEGTKGMRNLAEVVPRLIELSLFLFFLGFGDSMICTSKAVGVATIVSIDFCGSFYFYDASEHLWNPQSAYQASSLVRHSRPYRSSGDIFSATAFFAIPVRIQALKHIKKSWRWKTPKIAKSVLCVPFDGWSIRLR
jgi:hypothetical protein